MRQTFPKAAMSNPVNVLRKAGYSHFRDPKTNEESFILHLGPQYYPRFHIYIETTDNDITFDLHLDQSKGSYEGSSMHKGEYDGPVVEKEMQRIEGWVSAMLREERHISQQKTEEKPKTSSWTDWLFRSND